MKTIPLLTASLGLALAASLTVAAAPAPSPGHLGEATAASPTRGVLRGDLGTPSAADPLVAASMTLARHAGELGIDSAAFAFSDVVESPLGTHVHGREFRGGVAVLGSSAAVHTVHGRVVKVEARPAAAIGSATDHPIPAALARTVALTTLGLSSADAVNVARWLVPVDGIVVDTWRVTVLDIALGIAATIDVDAATGVAVASPDTRQFADYAAMVFDPNPIVTLQDPALRQPGLDAGGVDTDLDDAALNDARRLLAVRDVDDIALLAGSFTGPWVDVQGPAPMVATEGIFDFTRMDPRFEAAMSYTHLDRLQRHIQDELGLTGVNDEPQWVVAVPVLGFDNSFYQPGNDVMVLGAGGVDDGEDAEVIVHEYGHAIHDAQVPGWGDHHEGGSMGEGFGDFLAAAWFAQASSNGFQDDCVADWDATSYSSDDPACLRRMDSTKRYPDDMAGEVHDDGELWAAYLWRLRSHMVDEWDAAAMEPAELAAAQSDRVLRLLLMSHFMLSPTATFADAVGALQDAAAALDERDLLPAIEAEAEVTGFDHEPYPSA